MALLKLRRPLKEDPVPLHLRRIPSVAHPGPSWCSCNFAKRSKLIFHHARATFSGSMRCFKQKRHGIRSPCTHRPTSIHTQRHQMVCSLARASRYPQCNAVAEQNICCAWNLSFKFLLIRVCVHTYIFNFLINIVPTWRE